MKKLIFLLLFFFLPLNVFAVGSISPSTNNINVEIGTSTSFNIVANNAAGKIVLSNSNSSVISIDKSTEWLDNNSISVNIKANNIGSSTITLKLVDVATYDNEELFDSYTINVNVIEKQEQQQSVEENNDKPSNENNNKPSNENNNDKPSHENIPSVKKSSDNTLKFLSVEGYDINKIDNNNYSLSVSKNVSSINITGQSNDAKASVSGLGTKNVQVGENKFEIIVVSELGTKNIVNLIVNRNNNYYLNDLDSLLNDSEILEKNVVLNSDDIISKNDFNNIKKYGKKVNFDYVDENGVILYSWVFDGKEIANTSDVSTKISFDSSEPERFNSLTNYADGKVLNISYVGKLPKNTSIRVYVGDKYADNDNLNLYYLKNSDLKLESNNIVVNKGYIELNLEKGSEYFITKSNLIKNNNNNNIFLIISIIEFILIMIIVVGYLFLNKKLFKQNKNNLEIYNSLINK